jgi:4'-phosphopantetheinyl transferase
MWLDAEGSQSGMFEALLTSDEHVRRLRYRNSRDAARFVARRALLRIGLGKLLDVAPERLRFSHGPDGKPMLSEPRFARALKFNLAHSDGLAVFACSFGHELGIDVERVKHHDDLLDVAAVCFSPAERSTLMALPDSERTGAFYRCWTGKEAYVKAVGSGLTERLTDFDVRFDGGGPPALLRVGWRPSEADRWRLDFLQLPPGYAGTIAIDTDGCSE